MTITLTEHPYPLPPAEQFELIGLWRSEWSRTDYDWLEALNGDYSETLETISVVARIDGRPVATATVSFAKHAPETCLIGNVVTLAAFRGHGLARGVTEAAVELGFRAGCTAAFLGSSQHEGNVYERCGFSRLAGSIMRRPAPGYVETGAEFETGQPAGIRPAVWGDMPGFVRFLTEPQATVVIDYEHGLIAMAHAEPLRCVSAFAVLHDDAARRNGAMLVLAAGNRVLGVGTVTPGPKGAGAHRAKIDFATHENYAPRLDELLARLLADAASREVSIIETLIAETDRSKLEVLSRAGFEPIATLPGHLRLRHGYTDVLQLERRL